MLIWLHQKVNKVLPNFKIPVMSLKDSSLQNTKYLTYFKCKRVKERWEVHLRERETSQSKRNLSMSLSQEGRPAWGWNEVAPGRHPTVVLSGCLAFLTQETFLAGAKALLASFACTRISEAVRMANVRVWITPFVRQQTPGGRNLALHHLTLTSTTSFILTSSRLEINDKY